MRLTLPWQHREVIKRDGSIVNFDAGKIDSAILRAGTASNEFTADQAHIITMHVLTLIDKFQPTQPISVEQIQDLVESYLFETSYRKTLRAYIVYREQHRKLRVDKKSLIDVELSVNEYLDRRDWRINANANQGYSLGGLILRTH